jgi:hypothetical protein
VNLHLLSGLAYLAALVLIPAAVLLLAWRRAGVDSVPFLCTLLAVPVFAFVVGGAWFAVPDWLSRGPATPPTAMHPAGVFVLCGMFSIFYSSGGLTVIAAALALWRLVHPASFKGLLDRKT